MPMFIKIKTFLYIKFMWQTIFTTELALNITYILTTILYFSSKNFFKKRIFWLYNEYEAHEDETLQSEQ